MTKISNIYIYRAADAFIYLPTYIAEKFEFLHEDEKGCFYNVHWETANGDKDAIERMQNYNNDPQKEGFAIAIADPTAIAYQCNDFTCLPPFYLVATIIDKLIFWAVGDQEIANTDNKNFTEIGKLLRNNYEYFIHYDRNYETGNRLGEKIRRDDLLLKPHIECEYNTEFDVLKDQKNKYPTQRFCVISTDLLSVAHAISHSGYILNYSFSKSPKNEESDYLMTGIITSGEVLKKYEDELGFLIQSFRKAISLLYSSKYVARLAFTKLKEVAPSSVRKKMDPKTIDKMVDIIYNEKFYPCDMRISKKLWLTIQNSVKQQEKWKWNAEQLSCIGTYICYQRRVNNFLLYKSGHQLSLLHGISYATLLLKGCKRRYNFLILLQKFFSFPIKLSLIICCVLLLIFYLYKFYPNIETNQTMKELFKIAAVISVLYTTGQFFVCIFMKLFTTVKE